MELYVYIQYNINSSYNKPFFIRYFVNSSYIIKIYNNNIIKSKILYDNNEFQIKTRSTIYLVYINIAHLIDTTVLTFSRLLIDLIKDMAKVSDVDVGDTKAYFIELFVKKETARSFVCQKCVHVLMFNSFNEY